jgi:fluoride exporter
MLRYAAGIGLQRITGSFEFPFGTLAVNVAGCLAIGVVSELSESRGAFPQETRIFLTAGVLGGFTTFSAFGNESLNLLAGGERGLFSANVALNLALGLGAVWTGRFLARLIWR